MSPSSAVGLAAWRWRPMPSLSAAWMCVSTSRLPRWPKSALVSRCNRTAHPHAAPAWVRRGPFAIGRALAGGAVSPRRRDVRRRRCGLPTPQARSSSTGCIAPICWGCSTARLPRETVRTGHKCVGFEQDGREPPSASANSERAEADVVVAADGIHSRLQQFVVAPSAPVSSAERSPIAASYLAQSVAWPAGIMRNWLGAAGIFSFIRSALGRSSIASGLCRQMRK